MIEMFGLNLGTPLQGGILAALLGMLGLALRAFVVGMPERGRVANERKTIELAEMDKLLADYAEQIKAFRKEVHGYRNDLQVVQGELVVSDKTSSQRINYIHDLLFVIELLITDLELLAPKSTSVKQAKAIVKRLGAGDPAKSEALNTAETAVRDAQQTVRSAKHTVAEINVDEAKKPTENGK